MLTPGGWRVSAGRVTMSVCFLVGGLICGSATGPDVIPTTFEILRSGPATSSTLVAPPKLVATARGVNLEAMTILPSTNFQFTTSATRTAASGPVAIRVLVRAKQSSIPGLDVFSFVEYRVGVRGLRPGDYEVALVFSLDGRPEREEARHIVRVQP